MFSVFLKNPTRYTNELVTFLGIFRGHISKGFHTDFHIPPINSVLLILVYWELGMICLKYNGTRDLRQNLIGLKFSSA